MTDMDRRTERRIINSLDRLADIDALLDDLILTSRTGREIRRLTEEFIEIKDDLRRFDIPLDTSLSSRDGSMTLGCGRGPRTLDIPYYRRSAIGDILARDHPEVLVPEDPDTAGRALGFSIDGYYRQRKVIKITDGSSYRRMMEVITGLP